MKIGDIVLLTVCVLFTNFVTYDFAISHGKHVKIMEYYDTHHQCLKDSNFNYTQAHDLFKTNPLTYTQVSVYLDHLLYKCIWEKYK